ncbi:hypothetical protein VKT23_019454 [Stygiomarasmius scandens]|uniref:Uncharacterized protein n=1 Tax=Marasmiellus scandens TaxID=2682957 RepID=A0ABR1IL80_9AGAR
MSAHKKCVCIGPYPPQGTKGPTPGISSKLQWWAGGITTRPFPLILKCETSGEADRVYEVMQPWVLANVSKLPEMLLQLYQTDPDLLVLAEEFDSTPGQTYWAVKLGYNTGIFFNGAEAILNMDKSKSKFCRAFVFDKFLLALSAMATGDVADLNPMYNYDLKNDPEAAQVLHDQFIMVNNLGTTSNTPQAAQARPTASTGLPGVASATPRSPAASHPPVTPTSPPALPVAAATSPYNNISFSLNINSPGTLTRLPRTPTHQGRHQGTLVRHGTPRQNGGLNYWGRFYLQSHGWDDDDVEDLERMLRESGNEEDFISRTSMVWDEHESIFRFIWALVERM